MIALGHELPNTPYQPAIGHAIRNRTYIVTLLQLLRGSFYWQRHVNKAYRKVQQVREQFDKTEACSILLQTI